jgi:hypothetical protein
LNKKISAFLLLAIFISCSGEEVLESSSDEILETTTTVTQDLEKATYTADTTSTSDMVSQPPSECIDVNVPTEAPEILQVIELEVNSEICLMFRSTEPVQIHIHGINLHLDVDTPSSAGNFSMELKFEGSVTGEFEIEVHDSGIQFARLIVSP